MDGRVDGGRLSTMRAFDVDDFVGEPGRMSETSQGERQDTEADHVRKRSTHSFSSPRVSNLGYTRVRMSMLGKAC